MILYVVSAIPPITLETVYTPVGSSTPLRYPSYRTRGLTPSSDAAQEPTVREDIKTLGHPIPRKMVGTEVVLYRLDGQETSFQEELRYYDPSNINPDPTVTDPLMQVTVLQDLVASGLSNNIIASYVVDDEYIDYNYTDQFYNPLSETQIGGYVKLKSKLKSSAITYTPYSSYAQGVINNKARYGQSVTVKVYNPASGASLTKHIYDALPESALPGTSQYSLPYRVAADIRPDGCPIFAFQYNDGGTDQLSHATEYIKGGAWRRAPLNVLGLNGSYFDKLSLNNARDELNTRTALGLLGSMIGIGGSLIGPTRELDLENTTINWSPHFGMGNINEAYKTGVGINPSRLGLLGAAAGVAGTIGSYVMSSQKLRHQEDILNARCEIAVAPIQVGNSDFVRDTGMNKFYYVFTSYAGDDMWNFDAFLTRFGYNVGNMPIRNRHFYSRKRFVYIRANEMQVISNVNSYYQVNKAILEKVETQLRQGVRIWRTKPDAHYTLPDGNNIIEEKAYV